MRRLLITLIAIVSVVSCQKADQKQVQQSTINQDKEALAKANDKVQELSSQIEQLRLENQRLRTKNEFLTSQNEIIQPRMEQLIACYGPGIWDYADDSNDLVFVKSMKGAGFRDVITELNDRFKKYKQPRVEFKKKEDGTVFVGVDNEDQLGEQMGSNGALGYIAIVTYSLVSVEGVDCVYFDIGESEHASPGKYCKDHLEPPTPH